MIATIAHLSDIHIRKTPTRNTEYEEVFENLYVSLMKNKPDRIVLAGDLVHDYLDLQGEQLVLAAALLNKLAEIAPLRITRGNHDCRKKSLQRTDSIEAILKVMKNPNIIYYNETGFFTDDNIIWAVWHHGDKNNNPWKTTEGKNLLLNSNNKTTIDLYHDPINGCVAMNGLEMKSKSLISIKDFRGAYSMFGDIHKMQYLDTNKTKAYCGSLIAQDIGEGDDNFHGYLFWNIENKTVEEISIESRYSYKNIHLTPFVDFDDLDFEIENPTEFMRLRFVWNTLPHTRSKENERKLSEYIKPRYKNTTISNKNSFIESEKIEINKTIKLEDISNQAIQHEIFREHLAKIGVDSLMIEDIIKLDDEISATINIDDIGGHEWNIIKFGVRNFMSYEEFDIDWRDMDGLFQINGMCTHGKTTILKALTYILFGKALETDSRMKFGDMRYVNNRNGAKSCSAYMVIESGGEYFGLERKTVITTTVKEGIINGAPTTLSYFQLASPDDEMNKDNSLENLVEDKRIETQKKIETIIGTYDNFTRVVMTTSDTLNRILSNEMAVFIDSLLFDSGLDIFDKKLKGLKIYQDKRVSQMRYVCDIEKTNEINLELNKAIVTENDNILVLETQTLPDVQNRLKTGNTYVENLIKKLYKIDDAIYNLNIDSLHEEIKRHNETIKEHNDRTVVLSDLIAQLKEKYDKKRLDELLEKKESHKANEYTLKLAIRTCEETKRNEDHYIETINGTIFTTNRSIENANIKIIELKESKICPMCQQSLKPEHQIHIDDAIALLENDVIKFNDEIDVLKTISIPSHRDLIKLEDTKINGIKKEINDLALDMESVLSEIGTLTNDKNDVERRLVLQTEMDNIPLKIRNAELMIEAAQQKIDNYNNSLLQIEANKKIENGIALAKTRLTVLNTDEKNCNEDIFLAKSSVAEKLEKIKLNNKLIENFTKQNYADTVISKYKDCVHRDGIPKQMLSSYIIPKINITLEELLNATLFKVWLDEDDLRPKLAYNDRPTAIIDCISASGKERTFSSVPLKFALNQINIKAKPTIFLLDEVMGKLDPDSVEEFVEMLNLIKKSMKKLLVIEQIHEIGPDYLISVKLDENAISSLEIS